VLDRFQPYYSYMIPTCPRCAVWCVRQYDCQMKVKRRSKKKVVTCHVVSGAYLEKRSTDFNAFNLCFFCSAIYFPNYISGGSYSTSVVLFFIIMHGNFLHDCVWCCRRYMKTKRPHGRRIRNAAVLGAPTDLETTNAPT
jgi:hypothetical protein